MVDREEVDALCARHVLRNAPPRPSHCALHPPNPCVKPPHTIWWFKWSFSRDLDSRARRERPFAGLRPPASATATPLPWPRPGSLPNCPTAPIPPARCGNCWSGWLAPRDQKSLMSPASCKSRTARVAARSSRAPGARRPQNAAAPLRAAGLGHFSETFLPHHRFSRRRKSLWKAHDSPQRTPRRPLSSGGLARRDPFPGVRGPSRAAARSHPYRRAPMIRSPADFESLPGSLAAKGRSPKRAEL